MSRQLSRWSADTPDGRCCNCGTGIFDEVPVSKLALLAYPSRLRGGEHFELCVGCSQLEAALIQQSSHDQHPERLAHYAKMQEKYS